ncbi:E3 ubiquitin-protein ligase TRIM39-like [Cygnus olor]|uniref:E3 ubiquitin-protein ligase TRIM39-like n=1 Tax=Cygnus olor TaxID=8869 RepID=UPI001ADDF703|nr:E3 ubiquitin-protein ligase TRIM39-like [Cygnus olor]
MRYQQLSNCCSFTERKVLVQTRRTPESIQKDVERLCSVKTAEQTEKKSGASSAAPQLAVPDGKKTTSHAGRTMDISTTRALESMQEEVERILRRTMDISTTRALESMREEVERILSEKPAQLQSQLEVAQHATPPLEELTNTQTSLQAISEKVQSLMTSLQNAEASRKQDLEILRADIVGQITKELEAAMRSLTNESLWEMYSKLAVDVTLDADTAHPRLQVSEDGKSVTDTGATRRVPVKEERFDCQAFVLAKEAYASGRLYWEVDVGKRRNWILGVAQETVTRKGKVVLSPQNGFWAIALADGQEYGVHMDPWTHLTVSGRPQNVGIFLDISAKNLSFYNVQQKKALYTLTFDSDHSQEVKLFPFFSTCSTAIKADTEPLQIA